MSDAQEQLQVLDDLKAELESALAAGDWNRLLELNRQVRPAVDPLVAAVNNGQLEASLVQPRLEALNAFIRKVDEAAAQARDEARQSLQGVNQNRHAARAYQGVKQGGK